jgi:hypothetical protein
MPRLWTFLNYRWRLCGDFSSADVWKMFSANSDDKVGPFLPRKFHDDLFFHYIAPICWAPQDEVDHWITLKQGWEWDCKLRLAAVVESITCKEFWRKRFHTSVRCFFFLMFIRNRGKKLLLASSCDARLLDSIENIHIIGTRVRNDQTKYLKKRKKVRYWLSQESRSCSTVSERCCTWQRRAWWEMMSNKYAVRIHSHQPWSQEGASSRHQLSISTWAIRTVRESSSNLMRSKLLMGVKSCC